LNFEVKPQHIRAARGWLHWSAEELANKSGVRMNTIARIERGLNAPREETIANITKAFLEAGIELLPDGIRDLSHH
jgi:transcriptional regulator with XRE-family HTH domain